MFEWPKAEEGEIVISLPFKIFWATSIPLGAIIGFLMWLISKCEKSDWKKFLYSLRIRPRPSGSRSRKSAPDSDSSHMASDPAASGSTAHGDGVTNLPVGSTPAGTTPVGPAGDKNIAKGNGGVVRRWFRRGRNQTQPPDIENVHGESFQRELDIGKNDGQPPP
jgi:hypothetical protein